MYFLGIIIVIFCGIILNTFIRKKNNDDALLLELPDYRWPSFKNLVKEVLRKIKDFVVKTSVVIIPSIIILWVLQTFSFSFEVVPIEESMLAKIGKIFSYLFVPLGFGNWQSSVSLITGIFAKESIVSTFGLTLGGNTSVQLSNLLTPQAGLSFMAFVLLSAPCVAAISTIKKELGSFKMMLFAIGFQSFVSYVVSLFINQSGNFYFHNKELFMTILVIFLVLIIFILCIFYIIKKRKNRSTCSSGCSSCSKICDIRKSDFNQRIKEVITEKEENGEKNT
jgi:ferrous iron transport protein B